MDDIDDRNFFIIIVVNEVSSSNFKISRTTIKIHFIITCTGVKTMLQQNGFTWEHCCPSVKFKFPTFCKSSVGFCQKFYDCTICDRQTWLFCFLFSYDEILWVSFQLFYFYWLKCMTLQVTLVYGLHEGIKTYMVVAVWSRITAKSWVMGLHSYDVKF